LGVKEMIAVLLVLGGIIIIGIGAVQGKIPWDVLVPIISAWISAIISSFITATVVLRAAKIKAKRRGRGVKVSG